MYADAAGRSYAEPEHSVVGNIYSATIRGGNCCDCATIIIAPT